MNTHDYDLETINAMANIMAVACPVYRALWVCKQAQDIMEQHLRSKAASARARTQQEHAQHMAKLAQHRKG